MFDLSEDELQMLTFALFVPESQNANGSFEYANFGDAGTSVLQQRRRSRVDATAVTSAMESQQVELITRKEARLADAKISNERGCR